MTKPSKHAHIPMQLCPQCGHSCCVKCAPCPKCGGPTKQWTSGEPSKPSEHALKAARETVGALRSMATHSDWTLDASHAETIIADSIQSAAEAIVREKLAALRKLEAELGVRSTPSTDWAKGYSEGKRESSVALHAALDKLEEK